MRECEEKLSLIQNGRVDEGAKKARNEGWVTCADSVLALHSRKTVTCYGTRRSSKIIGSTGTVEDKENTSAKGNKVRIIITSIH